MRSLAFDNLPGTHVGEALAWTFRSSNAPHLPFLRSVSASGSAALQPLLAAAASQAAVLRQLTSLQLDCVKQLQETQLEAILTACPSEYGGCVTTSRRRGGEAVLDGMP